MATLKSVMIRRVLLLIALLVFLIAGCAGPRVTYLGEDVTNEEVRRIALAAEVIKASWISLLSTAEMRYVNGQLSESDWARYKDELGPDMVVYLKALETALGQMEKNPSPANRAAVLNAFSRVQTTMRETAELAAATLGEAYQ